MTLKITDNLNQLQGTLLVFYKLWAIYPA